MSVDIECVASGVCHDARDVCFVAVIDGNERVLRYAFIFKELSLIQVQGKNISVK